MNRKIEALDAAISTSTAEPSSMASPLLTTRQAAERLSLSEQILKLNRMNGAGPPYVKLGKLVRYDPHDLQAYVMRNTVRPTGKDFA